MGTHKPIHIGTSGWHYKHWRGPFYPENTSPRQFLEYYIEHFHTAEINNTFYQLPKKETFIHWRDAVPNGFVFSVKGSRYITHMKKLKDPLESLSKFMERVNVLEEKLGPILFQLPPNWNLNLERLKAFLDALPSDVQYAFEFRDQRWFTDQTEKALAEKGAAFCIYEIDQRQSPQPVTADFTYVRLHGPQGAYQGKYDTDTLAGWAGKLVSWSGEGKEVFCYFDNDEKGYAAQNALQLKEMVEKR